MDKINWKRHIRALKNEGTVLFVGPDIEKDESGKPALQQLGKKMLEDYKGEVSIDDDGFFFFIEPEAKNDVVYDMKEFYEKHDFSVDIYKTIATIPFHLIISLSPDDAIHNVFAENGVDHQFAYFDTYKTELEKPVKEKPLIYNLFGLATQGRYILTQEDYFNYIKAVIGDDVLPKKIISALSSASNFIFIGFDFEKWYVRLLLMILNFHLEKEGKIRHAIKAEKTDSLFEKLIEKQFNITFVENNALDFLTSLQKELKKEEMLRKLKPKIVVLEEKLNENQDLLSQNEEILDLSGDPKEKLKSQKAIEKLKIEIENLQQQLKNL